jgi:hypothetical protein
MMEGSGLRVALVIVAMLAFGPSQASASEHRSRKQPTYGNTGFR